MPSHQQLDSDIRRAMRADRFRFRQQLRTLEQAGVKGKPADRGLARLAREVSRSVALHEARRQGAPRVRFPEDLPVSARRDEIARAIREHQVVIVCGETGSGKSTQLPKICLELGRGIDALIGHTQPRRIAARSVAARIAEELGSPLGRDVGFKVRFAEAISPQTYVKLMTDGILLAESQGDPLLEQYDTVILDEAHERSLNIDFLIGYLKRLLPKRRDLKLIITSATIDAARFSQHFLLPKGPAPIVEVSGRTYPVELRYRPVASEDESDEADLEQAVLDAVDELARVGPGDFLIFMPTERDIHETAKALRGRPMPGDPTGQSTEILPLYARLSIREQQRVFQPSPRRRIVIATNVAESSLTVPGVRYVVDPGTARISRYSPRTKTQRLPIEPISQASADQRKGRCGRIGPGICVRLFSEADYLARDRFTPPEIQRTNLAAVILQTKALRLGEIERFPFLDPPKPDAIRDGYRTLFELGALDAERNLTELGRRLSRLPADPRIGRMILAAEEEDCLHEVLIIASALEVQDPRERPLEKQEAADACHAQYADAESDFLGYLKLWDFYHHLKGQLSRNQLRKACRQNFLSFNRVREWLDVHRELLELVEEAGLKQRPRRDQYAPIHRAVLTGLLSSVALRGDAHEYSVAGGGKAYLWPGAGVFRGRPKWVVAAEVVETSRRFLRTCARVDPGWIEAIAAHLVKRSYSDVHWDRESASAVAVERVALFGLTIVHGRRVHYGPIDAETSRQLLIQHGLVEGDLEPMPDFLCRNRELLEEMERLQAKLRRRDLLRGQWACYEFYDRRIPADVYDGPRLAKWLREAEGENPRLLQMTKTDLVDDEAAGVAGEDYPDAMSLPRMELSLDYQFEPGDETDGVTVTVPLEAVNQVDPQRLDWLVPGLLEEKILGLIRSLPKSMRSRFVPAAETAGKVLPLVRFGAGSIHAAVAAALGRIGGTTIPPEAFQDERLPSELRMNVRVVDAEGNTLAAGRDWPAIRAAVGSRACACLAAMHDAAWHRDGLTSWDFGDLPAEIDISQSWAVSAREAGRAVSAPPIPFSMKAHPTLIDRGDTVSLRLSDSPERSSHETRFGLRRLFLLAAQRELQTQVDWLPNLDTMLLLAATIQGLDLRRQLAELLAERAFLADQPAPRTRADFDRRLSAGRERIGLAVQEVAGLIGPLLETCHQARVAAEQAGSRRWQYAVDDVQGQLAALTEPQFLARTPWDWLRQYARYFRAIRLRLESLPAGGQPRDRRAYDDFLPRWLAYVERARQHESQGVFDPQLIHYRWMLEEYRVSLFAQKLGTAIPVSGKRLEQQWAKVR